MDKTRFILKFLNYKLFSGHKYGHGIHSPFVFEFITTVLNDRFRYKEYGEVEKIRRKFGSEERTILYDDYGAGSRRNRQGETITGSGRNRQGEQGETITGSGRKRSAMVRIKDIARYSAVNKKFGQLLFRIVRYFRPATILELGTSLGISTMYMAMANRDATVISIEADRNLAEIARLSVINAGLYNVEIINDRFENVLPPLIERLGDKLFVFIDGNHEKSPTLQYFNQLLVKSGGSMIIAVDDIHWSPGMSEAWQEIKSDRRVKITMDLFYMGLVFFNRGVQKQNFIIRY
jgi:predicted O-methyltransferase YrrM